MKTSAELQPLCRPHTSHVSTTRKKLENYSYGLQDKIGAGYSSQVFRGTNDLTGHTVAIKVIDLHKLTDRVLQDMLMSEISSLRTLRGSSNILQLQEVYSTRNNIYIITEFCESGDLVRVIDNRIRTEEQSAEIMEQLVKGYLEIYRNKIVHRDIKPANIFVEKKVFKIADFGFSILAEQVKDPCHYNVGSPLYMAPEVLLKNHYSFKSDIWALGIIYYELLFGCRPWSARDEKELAEKIRTHSISGLLQKPISRVSTAFLVGALNPDVSKRMSPEQLSRFCSWADLTQQRPEKQKVYIKSTVNSSVSYKQNTRTSTTLNAIYNPVCRRVKAIIPTMPSTEKHVNHSIVYTRKETIVVRRDNSKILLSQLHFCRFLYKIAMKLDQCKEVSSEKMRDNLKGMIYYKLAVIQSCHKSNVFGLDGYEEYRLSSDFQRIISVCKQYVAKYMETLGQLTQQWILNNFTIMEDTKIFIKQLYHYIENNAENRESQTCQTYLWLLDRSIAALELIKMNSSSSHEEFSRNSNIQSLAQSDDKPIDFKVIEDKIKALGIE